MGAAADAWEADEAVLARARRIMAARDAKPLPTAVEPKREKAHWDFLMEEMAWMAKEFAKCGFSS